MLIYEFIEDNTQCIQNPSVLLNILHSRDATSYIAYIKHVFRISKKINIESEDLPIIAAVWKCG
jgi:hypothetical protein